MNKNLEILKGMDFKNLNDESLKNLLVDKFSKNINKAIIPGESYIPVSGKVIDEEDILWGIESMMDAWLTAGRFSVKLERELARYFGSRFSLLVNSGSSANLLAFYALTSPKLLDRAIKTGDEIITVAAGFPTTINPLIQFGCIPVFVDVHIPTYNIIVDDIEKAITPKTKAIMIAHTLGNPFNVKKIKEICDKYNLWLIEDTCDALGSKYNNQLVGTFGDLATLSFYPAHHITMGEGGAVFTNSIKLKRIAESFRDWGRDCYCEPGKDNTCNKRFDWQLGDLPYGYDHKYTYSHMGYNLKITDMQAACGLAQVDKIENFITIRKNNYDFLYKNLNDLQEFIILPESEKNSEPSWFGFPISLRKNNKFNRNDLLKYLNSNKIGTRLLFSGNLIKQPYMKDVLFKAHSNLKNTDFVMENTFWIGVYPGLSKDHLSYAIEKLKIFFK